MKISFEPVEWQAVEGGIFTSKIGSVSLVVDGTLVVNENGNVTIFERKRQFDMPASRVRFLQERTCDNTDTRK